MRLVSCIVLTVTVCSIASINAAPTIEDKPAIAPAATTAVPPKPANAANPDVEPHAPSVTNNTSSSTPVATNTIVAKVNDTAKNDSKMETTTPFATNATTKPTPTVLPTTKETPSTSVKTTEKPTSTSVEPTTSIGNQTTVSPSVTTAIPVSTKVAPPSKERQFDGLSFVGGIILTVSLIAVATFSYKFYTTLEERSYRTL